MAVTNNNAEGLRGLPCRQHLGSSPWISPCPDAWECLLHSPRHQGHPGSHLVLGSAEWTGGLGWADTKYTQKLPHDRTGQATHNLLGQLAPLLRPRSLLRPFNTLPPQSFSVRYCGLSFPFVLFSWSAFPTINKGPNQMPCFQKVFPGTPSSHVLSCL